ncbi:Disease resistance protein [Melia azedarach]|uniref:Disease resistance protein n=1 Tax=Melia azedarach TaxID=155640 RepID=A0ACC1X1T3_MELAZ|nr:Disease resistance protein [Melia azedarach]
MDLRYSEQLIKLPDLSKAQNLEKLDLGHCTSLVQLHSSIQHLGKLVFLNLFACKSLKTLPDISACKLEELHLDGTAITELPSSIELQSRLVTLSLCECLRLKQLPRGISKLKSLKRLHLLGCSNLQRLPDGIGNPKALKNQLVHCNAVREVQANIVPRKDGSRKRKTSSFSCEMIELIYVFYTLMCSSFEGIHPHRIW